MQCPEVIDIEVVIEEMANVRLVVVITKMISVVVLVNALTAIKKLV